MAKVIGKNGIFLKQIRENCAMAFAKPGPSGQHSLRIELTKVFSPRQLQIIKANDGSLRGLPQLTGEVQSSSIDFYRDLENLQIAHVQIASKDPEVFEYAVEQVRRHTAQIYKEYMENAKKQWLDQYQLAMQSARFAMSTNPEDVDKEMIR